MCTTSAHTLQKRGPAKCLAAVSGLGKAVCKQGLARAGVGRRVAAQTGVGKEERKGRPLSQICWQHNLVRKKRKTTIVRCDPEDHVSHVTIAKESASGCRVKCSVTSALSFLKMQGCLRARVSSMLDRAKVVELIFARVFCWTTPARAAKPLISGAKGQLKLRLLGSLTVFDIWRRGGVSSTLSMIWGYLLDRVLQRSLQQP